MKDVNLRQFFRDHADCYADTDDSVHQAMSEDCFVEVTTNLLQVALTEFIQNPPADLKIVKK